MLQKYSSRIWSKQWKAFWVELDSYGKAEFKFDRIEIILLLMET